MSTVLLCAPAAVRAEGWRLFAGYYQTAWRIHGRAGHYEDCRTRGCDDRDLARANLDRSIGYRAGAEHPLASVGPWEFFAGGEMGVAFTEYNLSQRDVRIGEAFAVAGGRLDLKAVAIAGRLAGGAAAFDDGHSGLAGFLEAAVDIPLGKAGLRLGARLADHGGPRSTDYSVLLVDFGGVPRADGLWSLGWSIGISDPGRGAGESLALSAAPFSRLSVYRGFAGTSDRVGLALQITAHESEAKMSYFDVSGNERGKTIYGGAVTWHREPKTTGRSGWRYGLGLELSNWDDDHSLLVAADGKRVNGRFAAGLLAQLEVFVRVQPGMRVLVGTEKAYWSSIGLGELRLRVGFEILP